MHRLSVLHQQSQATWTDPSLTVGLMSFLSQKKGLSTLQKDFTLETTACPTRVMSPLSKSSPQKKDMFICISS